MPGILADGGEAFRSIGNKAFVKRLQELKTLMVLGGPADGTRPAR